MNYVVQLISEDGSITYAGKESWGRDDEPTTIFSRPAAKGKAIWWRKKALDPNMTSINLVSIDIKPVTILMDEEVAETLNF